MSTSQAKSSTDPQRAVRNWMAETLVVAGILAFGYFAIMLETSSWSGTSQPAGDVTLALAP